MKATLLKLAGEFTKELNLQCKQSLSRFGDLASRLNLIIVCSDASFKENKMGGGYFAIQAQSEEFGAVRYTSIPDYTNNDTEYLCSLKSILFTKIPNPSEFHLVVINDNERAIDLLKEWHFDTQSENPSPFHIGSGKYEKLRLNLRQFRAVTFYSCGSVDISDGPDFLAKWAIDNKNFTGEANLVEGQTERYLNLQQFKSYFSNKNGKRINSLFDGSRLQIRCTYLRS